MHSNLKSSIVDAVHRASANWRAAFNAGDAVGCAAHYEEDAVMHAMPFGTFAGREAIMAFWKKIIDDGFSDVNYVSPRVEIIDHASAVLISGWTMNKTGGVIHKELWVMQPDGVFRLREDHFEVHG